MRQVDGIIEDIANGTFKQMLIGVETSLQDFRRPGILGTRLSDGTYVSRRDSDKIVFTEVDEDGVETKKAASKNELRERIVSEELQAEENLWAPAMRA